LPEGKEKQAEELIKTIVEKINANSEKIKDWNQAFRIVFKDINVGYLIKVSMDGKVEKTEKDIEKKDSVVTIATEINTLQDILGGVISPMSAIFNGQLHIEGSIDTLFKLGAAFL
jgi:putative sterol carrier protein